MATYRRKPVAFGALGADVFNTLGVTMWEWLNPEAVRAEYEAVGKDPNMAPVTTFGDVIGAAAEDTRDVVVGAAGDITEGAGKIAIGGTKIVWAVAIGAGLYLAWRLFGKGKRK